MVSQETIDKILSMYIDKDFQKEVLRTPIVQGDRVCATNGHIMIFISKNLVETDYPAMDEPDCACFFEKEPNCNVTVQASVLAEKIKESTVMVPETYQQDRVQCKECEGNGLVEWKYKTWAIKGDCPACNGMGYIGGEVISTDRMIPDTSAYTSLGSATFQRKYLQVLLDTMELLGEEEFKIVRTFPDQENIFVLNENVRVLLMPVAEC